MDGFPVARAREHVEELAAKHDITIYEVQRQWSSEADIKRRTVYCADPTTGIRYMIALHEIGHIVDKVAGKVVFNHLPACEAAAWSWAVDNADPDIRAIITNREWRLIGRAWATNLCREARAVAPSNSRPSAVIR